MYLILAWICVFFGMWATNKSWKARNNAYNEMLLKFNGKEFMERIKAHDDFVTFELDEDDKVDYIRFRRNATLPMKFSKHLTNLGYKEVEKGLWQSGPRSNLYVD